MEALGLTPRQREALGTVARLTSAEPEGLPPTVRELADALDVAPTSAATMLDRLERAGALRLYPGIARGLVLLVDPAELMGGDHAPSRA